MEAPAASGVLADDGSVGDGGASAPSPEHAPRRPSTDVGPGHRAAGNGSTTTATGPPDRRVAFAATAKNKNASRTDGDRSPGHPLRSFREWSQRTLVQAPRAITVFDVADVLSNLLFLVASVLFYPAFYDLGWEGSYLGPHVGAWLFVAGSVILLALTLRDVRVLASTFRGLVKGLTAPRGRRRSIAELVEDTTATTGDVAALLLYVPAAVLFVVGSAYFLPALYERDATMGCTLFVVGCLAQVVAALWDTGNLLTAEGGGGKTREEVAIMMLPFIGSLLFLIGCLFFYPRYQNDTFDAVYATTYLVAASLAFLASSLLKVYVLSIDFEDQAPTVNQAGDGIEQSILLRRRVYHVRTQYYTTVN